MRAWLAAFIERHSENKLIKLLVRYGEIVRYAIVGVLTTAVNFAIYLLFTLLLFPDLMAKNEALYAFVFNCIAWAGAVLFAFFANRIYVFQSREKGGTLVFEFLSFVALRVASGAVETLTPSILIKLGMNDLVAKAIVAIAVIVLNYVFARFITFAKSKSGKKDIDE